jgi:hypothetical protein
MVFRDMSNANQDSKRHLEAEGSPASISAAAEHDDELSPALGLRESVGTGGSQRLGNGVPVDGPIVSFPDDDEEEPPA